MRKLIFALALIWGTTTCTMSVANSAPKHRYQPASEQVDAKKNAADSAKVAQSDSQQNELEAYSDTTSAEAASSGVDDNWEEDHWRNTSPFAPARYSDPFDYIGSIFGKGALMTLIFLCIIVALLALFAPFIVVIMLLRYLVRRHNDRVKLAEKAMEQGQPLPESRKSIDMQSDEYLVKRGLRNGFLGLGLAVMFTIWDADFLAGIGALLLFYGIGQTVIGCLPAIKEKLGGRKDF